MKKILACLFSACCLLQALLELAGLLGLLPPDFLSFESFCAAQALWLLFLTLLLGFLLFSCLEKKTETVCSGRHSGETDEVCATGKGDAVADSFRLALTSASLYLFFFALRRGDPFIQMGVFLLALVLFSFSRRAVSSDIPVEPGCEHANHEDKEGKDGAHVKDCSETQADVKDIAGMFPKWLSRLELIQLFPLGLALTTAVHFFLLLLLPGGAWRLEPEQVEAWGIFLLVLLPALLAGGVVFLFVRLKPETSLLGHSEMEASPMATSRISSRWLLLPLALLHIGVLSRILVLRVQNFNTPNFDFGLFVQMFHYMDKTGLPLTTLERNTLLSHFQVHFSPIFYLFLPFYKLWPRPETLQILQILVAASALIPAFLIVRELRLPRGWQTALCALLLLHPGLSGSSLYDLHENCFLAPLILWLLWAALRRKWGAFSVFALLLLGVKEDAFIYLFSVGLWLLCGGIQGRDVQVGGVQTVGTQIGGIPGCEVQAVLDPLKAGEAGEKPINEEVREKRQSMKVSEKKKWQSLSLNSVQVAGFFSMLDALVYFAAVSAWLSRSGEGVMLYRFEIIQALPDWGLLGYALTAFSLPGWILEQLFMPDKLLYLLKMLLPFGLLPLFSRRLRHGFLLLPFVLINLLSNWSYQYNLNFQYHYGTTVLLFFVSALVLWESQTARQPGLHAACGGEREFLKNVVRPAKGFGLPARSKVSEHVSVCSSSTLDCGSPACAGGRTDTVYRTSCPDPLRRLVAALLAFALLSASALTLPEWSGRLRSELAEASLDQFSPDVHEALAAIPESDTVYTSSFFATALAARPFIFEVGPGSSYPIDASDPVCQPDVIVLDERYPEEIDAMAGQIADWEAEGFETSYRKVGVLRILKKGKK
ncbi:MAG: DUF2079 domain-containing protein [Clostridiales bacterium]|nr:DUF2079 domain-containing protein [Clostridiales bacterium]